MSLIAEFQFHTSIREIDREAWNALAQPLDTPFLEWEWLDCLESGGCVEPELGWQPCHMVLRNEDRLVAAAPLYLKGHSRGEFVFDQQWSDVSHRIGVPYYPKLVGMSPFTPARGYRFLIDPEFNEKDLTLALLDAIDRFCDANGISGLHFLHTDAQWADMLKDLGWKPWLHHALVWENHDFTQFEDYVCGFKSKQRNNIRRERRIAAEQLNYRVIPGEEADPALFSKMYDFYQITCEKFWNWSHYLNREFFMGLGERLPHRINLVAAYKKDDDREPVAMSFQVKKNGRLYGRYWGANQYFDQLHFEICYYQPIQWAVENGFAHYDAGSGNARHKQRRGFPAHPSYSLHKFYHPTMTKLWDQNIDRINEEEAQVIQHINRQLKC